MVVDQDGRNAFDTHRERVAAYWDREADSYDEHFDHAICRLRWGQARRHATHRGLAIEFAVGDARCPAFPDATFDLLISRHVFWALPDSEKAAVLSTWRRLLRPDGCVAILDGDWCIATPNDRGDASSLTAEEVRSLMEGQGFHEV